MEQNKNILKQDCNLLQELQYSFDSLRIGIILQLYNLGTLENEKALISVTIDVNRCYYLPNDWLVNSVQPVQSLFCLFSFSIGGQPSRRFGREENSNEGEEWNGGTDVSEDMPGHEGAQQVDVRNSECHEDGGKRSEQTADFGIRTFRNLLTKRQIIVTAIVYLISEHFNTKNGTSIMKQPFRNRG